MKLYSLKKDQVVSAIAIGRQIKRSNHELSMNIDHVHDKLSSKIEFVSSQLTLFLHTFTTPGVDKKREVRQPSSSQKRLEQTNPKKPSERKHSSSHKDVHKR